MARGKLRRELTLAARHQFALDTKPSGSKLTYRQHLEKVAETRDEVPPELIAHQIPDDAAHVWLAWLRLHAMRPDNGMGFTPIGWEALDAFNRLLELHLSVEEIELLEALELEYRKFVRDAHLNDGAEVAPIPVDETATEDEDSDEAPDVS